MSAPVLASTPYINLLRSTSALLGGQVTSDGGSSVTERGVVWSKASDNTLPAIGGSGVTKQTTSGTTGDLWVSAGPLVADTDYCFRAYATNGTGTTYSGMMAFHTAHGAFVGGTYSAKPVQGVDIWVTYTDGTYQKVENVVSVTKIDDDRYNGTYRDIFTPPSNVSSSFGEGSTGFIHINCVKTGGIFDSTTTQKTVSDDMAHVPLRQSAWIETGVLFTDCYGITYPFWLKDIRGYSNCAPYDPATIV